MNFSIRFLSLVVLVIAFRPAPLTGQIHTEQIQFYHLTDREGLSQRNVRTILQDHEGYIWFGTHDGLNKYNGYEITVYRYDQEDPGSLSYNEISEVYEDSGNNLWIATLGGGVNLYNREKDNFIRYNYENITGDSARVMNENTTHSITEDPNGMIWLGTENGIVILDPESETFTFKPPEPKKPGGLSHRVVSDLFTDSQNNVWIGTHNGLNMLPPNGNEFKRFLHDPDDPNSISDNHIQKIYEDSNGDVWIGTQRGGLNLYDFESGEFTSFMNDKNDPNSISDNSVFSIREDSQGVLWIGTENEGLNTFDRDTQKFYHHKRTDNDPFSLNNNAIYSIYEDSRGSLLIGTYNGGVNITDRATPRFKSYQHNPYNTSSLSTNSVLTFMEDRSGNIWIGTDGGGLNLFDRESKEFTVYRPDPADENSVPGDVIFDLAEDEKGYIWIATYRNGLSRFNPQTGEFRHFKYEPDNPKGLNHNDIFALHIDSKNPELIWAGTNGGGINLLDTHTEEFTHFTFDPDNPKSINNDYIRFFHEDSHDTFRVGNYGGALVTLDREKAAFTMLDITYQGVHTNVVQMIFEDSSERLWLSTWGGGLKRLDRDNNTFKTYTERDGLQNNNLHGITEDNRGHLWISSNKGISEFNPETEKFVNYGVEDGLQSWEFNPRAVMKDSDGYMYFGGVNGFNRFHPDSIFVPDHEAPVVFTGFRIFNEPVQIDKEGSPLTKHISKTEELVLSYSESVLTFEYVTLSFDINNSNQYAYKLEGFDSDWNEVGNLRSATYTNLAPGKYTFRVKAANSNGIWSENEASINLLITPPFWKTTWFYLFSALCITGIIGGGVRWRIRSVTEQNKRLEKEVALQTKDLKKTLTELNKTRNELVEKAHTAGMADLATSVLHNVGNILNSVNVSASHITGIIKKSQLKNLQKANQLLRENRDNIDHFIQSDPKGKKLLDYYLKLEEPIRKEHEQLIEQNQRLTENINLIIDVVLAQQNYSKAGRLKETLSLQQIVEDTITLQASSFENHNLTIRKEFQPAANVEVEKSKLVHILVNLLKNAKESIEEQNPEEKLITISIREDKVNNNVCLSIRDTGTGIPKSQQAKIFTHGFTTKETGHGFGLHSCANYMNEMGGKISVESDGPGKGSIFTLLFPVKTESDTTSTVEQDVNHSAGSEKEEILKA